MTNFLTNYSFATISNDNIYKDVLLHTGSRKLINWENSIVTRYENNKIKVISFSNHYLCSPIWPDWYNQQHKIYDNMDKNYNEILLGYKINKELFDDNKIFFYFINAFCFSNSGHDLSTMLDFVHYIIENKVTHILILKGYKETNNFKLIEKIIPEYCIFYELDLNTIYSIKNIIIIYPEVANILKHSNLIEKLTNIIEINYSHIYQECKDKNIILMKTNRNENVFVKSTQICCEKMLTNLENNGFIYIIPEKMDIFKLCIYLLNAKSIIFSTGSILYTNKLFFNKNAKKIFISHVNEKTFYDAAGVNVDLYITFDNNNFDLNDNYLDYIKQIENFIK